MPHAVLASLAAIVLFLAARGETPAAFGWRGIPAGCVAPLSNTPGILGRRALPAGRLATLGATLAFHHGLLGASDAPGTLRGRVDVRRAGAERDRRPNPADLGMPTPPRAPDRRSVVYLDPAPQAAFESRDAPRARIDQRDESFVPHVLAIVAGTTVDFPNSDVTYHNVFSLSRAKAFDLGRYARGKSKAVRFDNPGIVRVFCEIHSHMSAFILVFAHRYFAVTDADGDYRIDNVPPGTYNAFVWNESVPLESRRVTVPEAGGDVELNFSLTRR